MQVKAGEWTPSDLQPDWVTKTWKVNKFISALGEYEFQFQYTSGAHRLDFRAVCLLENGLVNAMDEQPGHSGTVNVHTLYRFGVPKPKEGASYELRAEIKGDGGTDSLGYILVANRG